ncbi:MAG TPA: FUSC family protein [Devosiaceae bacterium]|nr:FUSC family protein [Devosiaceae bacterium]
MIGREQAAVAAKFTHWLNGLDLSRLSFMEALRAAVAVAAVAAVASIVSEPALYWAAMGALFTCIIDPGGAGRLRRNTLAGFTMLSSIAVSFGAASSALGWGWATVFVLCFLFVCGMVRVYGDAATPVGVFASLACAMGVGRGCTSPGDLATLSAVYCGGCLWAMLLSLTIWRIRPFQPIRRALAECYRALASIAFDVTEGTAGASSAEGPRAEHLSAAHSALEASRRALGDIDRGRGLGPRGDELLVAIEFAERIIVQLAALGARVAPSAGGQDATARYALRRLAVILNRRASTLDQGGDAALSDQFALDRLARSAQKLGGPLGGALADIGLSLSSSRRLSRRVPTTSMRDTRHQGWLAPLQSNLTWKSVIFRHAVRSGLAVAVTVAFSQAVGLHYGYWMSMAVIVVLQPYVASTWVRALERVIGSVLGGCLAALLDLLLAGQPGFTVALFPIAFLTLATRPINYALFVTFLTPFFIVTIDLSQPETTHLALPVLRIANNVAGGVFGLLCGLALWPSWEPSRLCTMLASAVEASGRVAALVLAGSHDEDELLSRRRIAERASADAEASRRRFAVEGWWRRSPSEPARTILIETRELMAIVSAAVLNPPAERSETLGGWLQAATSAIAGRLRGTWVEMPLLDQAPAPGSDDARAVQQVLLLELAIKDLAAIRGMDIVRATEVVAGAPEEMRI